MDDSSINPRIKTDQSEMINITNGSQLKKGRISKFGNTRERFQVQRRKLYQKVRNILSTRPILH